jgi:hypothetical protein
MRHAPTVFATFLAIFAQLAIAQATKDVSIREPGVYDLTALFKRADRVALVKVTAGDSETYKTAVYKAEVVKSFKGGSGGQTLFFGPYLGNKLGSEYILFLHDASKTISPKTTSSSGFGTVRYAEVFDEGYSSMEISYECVFDGPEASQTCDYGVRVCTDYIKLPKSMPAFPSEGNDPPFGCRWVRKAVFMSFIEGLRVEDK